MSHYDISYDGLEGEAKADKAIADIKDWLGEERFNTLTEEFERTEHIPYQRFKLMMAFAGIQGYPVVAWHEKFWPGTDWD